MTTAVVDASIAVRWVVQHPLTPKADRLLELYDVRIAPQVLVGELGNSLWKYVRTNEISLAQAHAGLAKVIGAFVSLEQDSDHATRAMEIAADLDHPFYDCLYLAAAEARDCPLITDDRRLLKKLARKRRFRLIALADIA